MDKEELDGVLSWGWTLEQIGKHFGKNPATVSYWMKKYGLEAVNSKKHAARGAIPREELERAVESGMSIAEIAVALNRSKGTIRHWLTKYGLRTRNRRGRRPTAEAITAREAGVPTLTQTCPRHGATEFVLEGRGYYRCMRCRMESVAKHRRKLKEILVADAGGSCVVCGYDRHPRALEFHHIDPTQKQFALSSRGVTLSLETLRAEARKCVLLCSNCHAEVEDGLVSVPLEFTRQQGLPIHAKT